MKRWHQKLIWYSRHFYEDYSDRSLAESPFFTEQQPTEIRHLPDLPTNQFFLLAKRQLGRVAKRHKKADI